MFEDPGAEKFRVAQLREEYTGVCTCVRVRVCVSERERERREEYTGLCVCMSE
jgi:hypothetical protein